jgi:hypothetical protein
MWIEAVCGTRPLPVVLPLTSIPPVGGKESNAEW